MKASPGRSEYLSQYHSLHITLVLRADAIPEFLSLANRGENITIKITAPGLQKDLELSLLSKPLYQEPVGRYRMALVLRPE